MELHKPLQPPPKRPLDNIACPYCGISLDNSNATKEHVVGRSFVPIGTLNGSWNLILRACKQCNTAKSELEDDISAISLFLLDPMADKIVHKAKSSTSRRTRRAVIDSSETFTIKGTLVPGVNFTATVKAPPQIDHSRAFKLAWYHLAGVFYLITYDKANKIGRRWLGTCMPIEVVSITDYGNAVERWFMTYTEAWHPKIVGHIASGFYRIAIRRHPESEVWSWAFEWNKTVRLIGFLGEEHILNHIVKAKPEIQYTLTERHRLRDEVPLEEESDTLFRQHGIEM